MTRSNDYYTLAASLPYLRQPFLYKDKPINRIQLERRLGMLEPEDEKELLEFADLLEWDRLTIDRTDEEIVDKAAIVVPRLRSGVVRQVALWRLEFRTVVAALRRRARGESVPPRGLKWGYGRWVDHIRRNWVDPHFRLELVFPQLPELKRMMDENDTKGVERTLLRAVWDYVSRAGDGHEFDFEAIVVYLIKWTVAVRWRRYDGAEAQERFDEMVEQGLGEYASVFA